MVLALPAGVLMHPLLGVLLAGAAVCVRPAVRRLADAKRVIVATRELPDLIESLARSLRSGASMRGALAEAAAASDGPIAEELRAVHRSIVAGRAVSESLEAWGGLHVAPSSAGPLPLRRRGRTMHTELDRSVRLAASALAIAAEVGGAQARMIDAVALTLREQRVIAGDVAASAAQARLSAIVLVAVPLVFAVMQMATNPDAQRFMTGTPAGMACLLLGIGLDGLGAVWMHALVRPH